jgi:hypothetical protein
VAAAEKEFPFGQADARIPDRGLPDVATHSQADRILGTRRRTGGDLLGNQADVVCLEDVRGGRLGHPHIEGEVGGGRRTADGDPSVRPLAFNEHGDVGQQTTDHDGYSQPVRPAGPWHRERDIRAEDAEAHLGVARWVGPDPRPVQT